MSNSARQDYSHFTDEELMKLFQNGINEAFNELVIRYQKVLYYRFILNIKIKQDCEDLIQDTFLCVSRSKDNYLSNLKFSPWLYAIAGNLLINHYRKKNQLITTCLTNEPADKQLLADISLHQANLLITTRKAIAKLAPKFSRLLQLRVIDEYSYNEIRDITGLPIGTIKSRIGRGKIRLRESLKMYKKEY
ncbi:MAG: sigma-70 family RNA polymerase sigma factor [Balneolales bacterium]